MMKTNMCYICALMLISILTLSVNAQPPALINYQGRLVDGRPALVAIGEGSPRRLLHVRAADATGSSWFFGGLPNLAHPQIPLPLSSVKLLEVDGEPAIFYGNCYLRSAQVPQGALHWMAVQP